MSKNRQIGYDWPISNFKEDVVFMLPAKKDTGNVAIDCPFCGVDFVHLEKVVVNAGGIVMRIEHQLPKIEEGRPEGRGTYIQIWYWSECGHRWIQGQGFHKGQTYMHIHRLPDHDGWVNKQLWRD